MGWFEEQVKQRKDLDQKAFEDSFLSLAGIKINNPHDLSDDKLRENYAISQILDYYNHQMPDIPTKITDFNEKLKFALSRYDIEFQKVELNDNYVGDGSSPLLIFTFLNNIPVVLFPIEDKKYYYINYSTGKKVKIDASLVNRFEIEAYTFANPLPPGKITVKKYARFLLDSIRTTDVLLMVFLSTIATVAGLLMPYLTKLMTGEVAESNDINRFILISVYVVAAATGLLVIKALQGYFHSRIGIKVMRSAQSAAMIRVLSLPASFFKSYSTGELTARFKSIQSLADLLLNGVFMTLLTVIMSLAYLFQMVGFADELVLPVVLILLVSSGFTVLIAFVRKNYTRKQLELSSKESGVTYEMINGIQKLRLSGAEKRAFAKWANVYARSAKATYNPPLILRLAPAVSLLIALVGNILVYYVASRYDITVGDFMAFIVSYGILSAAFASLGQVVGTFFSIVPLYEMARPILETEPEIFQDKTHIKSIKGDISFRNVSFRYVDDGPLILDDLSLDIKAGEYVAVVGQTGCGKTTLVRLLLGFETPESGSIAVDGVDIKEVDPTSLRKKIGTVMQNGTLFHADIMSNILISSSALREKDAWEAAEIAGIADDIREMPMGMKTMISEGQGGISGGQKQRIMIARAIVHKPKILIFDEATSALDNKTQKSISESINKLNCTRIVIAHRLSTIKNADRIIMLEGGKIIESGDYQTLIDKKGKFAELVDRQRL